MEKKAKIIATLGPSIFSENKLKKLIDLGVDAFRINFSHDTNGISNIVAKIRKIEKNKNKKIALIADLQGVKLRVGKMSMETNITLLKETVKKQVLKQLAILSCKLKSKILPAKLLNFIDDHYNNIKQNGLQDVHFKAQSFITATMKVAVISPCDKNKVEVCICCPFGYQQSLQVDCW